MTVLAACASPPPAAVEPAPVAVAPVAVAAVVAAVEPTAPSCPEPPRRPTVAPAGAVLAEEETVLSFPVPARPDETIVVAAVGDVIPHDVLQQQARRLPDGFASLWSGLTDLFRRADVTFANLESPVAPGVGKSGREVTPSPAHHDGWVYSGYPMFNAPRALAEALRDSGVDVVSAANNHALDRHALGVDRTIDTLDAVGLAVTGVRPRAAPDRPWHAITEAKGRRIAWLGCTYGTNGLDDTAGQVLNCYRQRAEVLETLAALAADPTVDAVIFTPHWGREYRKKPTPRQEKLTLDAIEAGATAVLGSHPHVVQRLDAVPASDGRRGVVLYSLGNFIANQRTAPARRSSLVLLLALAPDPTRHKLAVAGVRWVPTRIDFGTPGRIAAVPIAADGAVEGEDAVSRALVAERLANVVPHPAHGGFELADACGESGPVVADVTEAP